MNSHRLVLLLLSLGLLGLAGCDDEGGTGSSPSFTAQFEHMNSDYQHIWVALHDAAGDSLLAVQRVGESGQVVFYDLPSTRISVTIVRRELADETFNFYWVDSYLNVPASRWKIDLPLAQMPLGTAEVTCQYPPGHYPEGVVRGAGTSTTTWDVPESGEMLLQLFPAVLVDGMFSACGAVFGGDQDYCGWIARRSFQSGSANHYTIALDHAMPEHTITTSRSASSMTIRTYQGDSPFEGYIRTSAYRPGGVTSFDIEVCPIPTDRYGTSTYYYESDESYFEYLQYTSGIPEALEIPTTAVEAVYNPSEHRFENIAVSGEADLIAGVWSFVAGGGQHYRWSVATEAGNSNTLRRPPLPDSLGVNGVGMLPAQLGADDYDTANDLDDVIGLRFQSDRPWHLKINQYYTIQKLFLSGERLTVPQHEEWPLRIR